MFYSRKQLIVAPGMALVFDGVNDATTCIRVHPDGPSNHSPPAPRAPNEGAKMKTVLTLAVLMTALSSHAAKYCGRYQVYAGINSGVIDGKFDPTITGNTVISSKITQEQWPEAGDCVCVSGTVAKRVEIAGDPGTTWYEFLKVTGFQARPAEACKELP